MQGIAATTEPARCHTSQPAAGQSRATKVKSVDWGKLRVAGICIGVEKYKHLKVLKNPVRDAKEINKQLNAVAGCRSILVTDPEVPGDILKSVRNCLKEPDLLDNPPEIFLFTYSGHAIQRDGEVYLVPTNAKVEKEAEDCDTDCFSLGQLLKTLRNNLDMPVRTKFGEDRAIVFLVVLDSCRIADTDPEVPPPRTASRHGHGALALEPAPGSAPLKYTLYFSCSRTTVAFDGPRGGHSLFAQELLDEQHGFFAEGVTLRDAIDHVTRAVVKKGRQTPVEYYITTIPRHFCIRPSAGGAHAGPAGGTADGGGAGAGGGHTPRRQVDADVVALLREWKCEDDAECLAENGVWTMKALDIMTEQDRKEFRCSLELRELLQHLAEEKKKRASDGSKVHKVHYLDETRAIG
jgi:hypothetical protein